MSTPKAYDDSVRRRDNIFRESKKTNFIGNATFIGLRLADPFLQYSILARNYGSTLISKLGGSALPAGPALVTNTFYDRLGLSPYRSILFAMSLSSMLKQNTSLLTTMETETTPLYGFTVGVGNAIGNSLNSLLFICAQTSASTNGEYYPQTPLIVGTTLFSVGLFLEWYSEVQRAAFKRNAANRGKLFTRGLFGYARHINYSGYMLWRTGYALAAGGWLWGAVNAGLATYAFTQQGIPVLQCYLQDRVSLPVWHDVLLMLLGR